MNNSTLSIYSYDLNSPSRGTLVLILNLNTSYRLHVAPSSTALGHLRDTVSFGPKLQVLAVFNGNH